MSSSFVQPARTQAEEVNWARLIPGEGPAVCGRKKLPQSIRAGEWASVAEMPGARANSSENVLAAVLPGPLQGKMAWRWLKSITADFALVGLNWLLVGALLVPLRALFPRVWLFRYAAGAPVSLLGIALMHAALITLVGYTEGLYAAEAGLREQARILGKSVLWATLLLGFSQVLQGAPWVRCSLICEAGLLDFGMLLAWRRQNEAQEHISDSGTDRRNVVIVGAGGVGRRLASWVKGHPDSGRRVCGFLDNNRPLGDGIVGRVSDLARLARTSFVDEVIVAAPHDRSLTLQVLREARRLRLDLKIVPDLFGCRPAGSEVEQVGGLPVICLHSERLPAAGLVLKRWVDVVGASLALAILSPLLGLIAALIKLDSRGPVFYMAQRAGRKGRLFRCCKFRTMVSNADALKDGLRQGNQRSGPFFKIADDPRITRLGRILRRYSLDELPQFWNVLKGEMSLVGPRPHPLDDVAAYEIEHLARLDVTPGITGLWQVTARRDPSFQRGMELDREYIRTWSLRSDLRILARTLSAVVRGSGE